MRGPSCGGAGERLCTLDRFRGPEATAIFLRPLILALVLLAAPLAALSAGASSHALIQPGAQHDGICTLNFVYDGVGPLAGRVFIGTAGHCVDSVGQSVSSRGNAAFGTVVHMWADRSELDFALIEVAPAFHDRVVADVKGRPGMPSGHTTAPETQTGDLVLFSGYGTGYSLTPQTRENRVGVLVNDDEREYGVEGPILWGDSGGPVVHQDGRALGIVSRLGSGSCLGCDASWLVGPTVDALLKDLAERGWTVELRTAS